MLNYSQRLEEAAELMRKAVGLAESALGKDAMLTIRCRSDLGSVLRRLGRLDEAIRLQRLSVSELSRVYGPDNPLTLGGRRSLAITYFSAGRLDESEAEHRKVWESVSRTGDHRSVPDCLTSLAVIEAKRGHREAALKLYERSLAHQTRLLGKRHNLTAHTMMNFGLCLWEGGDRTRSVKLAAEGLSIIQQLRSPGHQTRLRHEISYARILMNLKRFEDAEKLLLASYAAVEREPMDRRMRSVVVQLDTLYRVWKKPGRRAPWQKNAHRQVAGLDRTRGPARGLTLQGDLDSSPTSRTQPPRTSCDSNASYCLP